MSVKVFGGDCLDVLKTLQDNSVHSVVCDPPYGLSEHSTDDIVACLTAWLSGREYVHSKNGFMQKSWDSFVPGPEIWRECLRVLKPGGNLIAFAGTRTQDLMGISIRLAGFEIKDGFAWLFSQGMPHGLNIGKAIDKKFGAERTVIGTKINTYDGSTRNPSLHGNPADQSNIGKWGLTKTPHGMPETLPATPEAAQWEGWNTTLKSAFEPIVCARKPLDGIVVENVLKHGVGGFNIDASRLPIDPEVDDPRLGGNGTWGTTNMAKSVFGEFAGDIVRSNPIGRYPANVMYSEDIIDEFAKFGEKRSGVPGKRRKPHETHSMSGRLNITGEQEIGYADSGSVARFFYCAKVSPSERGSSKHPTMKPESLMRYICKLVTPRGGVILDPFAGSGTTGQAAVDEGFDAILIEKDEDYLAYLKKRLALFIED